MFNNAKNLKCYCVILVPFNFFRVFRRIKIKYRIIIMKLCMRKCVIVKKIEICIHVMIKKIIVYMQC